MALKISSPNKIYVLLSLIFLMSLLALGSYGLTESSEARYAEIGREMLINHDYIHPKLLEIRHYHKPPLTYYLVALGYKIFGINEFGARFFLQIALVLQIFFVYKIAQVLFDNIKISFFSAIIYFSFPIILISTNNLTTDAFLTTFEIIGIYFWLLYKQKHKIYGLYLSAVALGLGFLTKGPVVLLPFVVFVITYFIIFKKKFKFNYHLFLSVLIFLGISVSWFALVVKETPELWDYFFKKHTIERALNAETFNRDKPFWYFLVLIPALGFPWVIFLIFQVIDYFKKNFSINPKVKFLLINLGVVLLCFSLFSSKRVLYILPIFIYLAILSSYLIYHSKNKFIKYFIKTYKVLFVILFVGFTVAYFLSLLKIKSLYFIFLLLFFVATIIYSNLNLIKSQYSKLMSLSFLFIMMILVTFRVVGNQNPNLINSTKSLAKEIRDLENKTGKHKVAVFDKRLSSMPFYLHEKTIQIHLDRYDTKREVRFEKDTNYQNYYWNLENDNDFKKLIDFLEYNKGLLVVKCSKDISSDIQKYLDDMQIKKVDRWCIYY
ncbi:ArnT family glycosyltransferase [Psychroflexus sp. MBR-150]|jgi:4-amino-4-deoxy-L-arabinose transferase